MALATNALVTLGQAKDFLKITQDDQDSLVTELINRASDFMEGPQGCNRPLALREFIGRLPSWRQAGLPLPVVPLDVAEEVLVELDGIVQTVWRTEDNGDPANFDVVVRRSTPVSPWVPDQLWRGLGWRSTSRYRPDPISLTYWGGFVVDDEGGTVPGDLRDATFLVIQTLYRLQEKGIGGISTMTGSPIGTVGFEQAAASLIPMAARRTIDSYRLISL